MAREFYSLQNIRVHNQKLCYKIALNGAGNRISGFKKAINFMRVDTPQKAEIYFTRKIVKEHYPIEIKGDYICNWQTYLNGLACKLLNGNIYTQGDEFKYLILEINKRQEQTS